MRYDVLKFGEDYNIAEDDDDEEPSSSEGNAINKSIKEENIKNVTRL